MATALNSSLNLTSRFRETAWIPLGWNVEDTSRHPLCPLASHKPVDLADGEEQRRDDREDQDETKGDIEHTESGLN
jgi:hypothetical protein